MDIGQAQMASGSAKSQACSSSGSNRGDQSRPGEVAAWGRRVNGSALTPAVNGQPWASNIGRDFGGHPRVKKSWLARLLRQGHFSPSLHRQSRCAAGAVHHHRGHRLRSRGEFAFTASDPLCPSGTEDGPYSRRRKRSDPQSQPPDSTPSTGDSGEHFLRPGMCSWRKRRRSSTSTGLITFHGGTGAFAGFSGHGVNNGTSSPEGNASATSRACSNSANAGA